MQQALSFVNCVILGGREGLLSVNRGRKVGATVTGFPVR